MSRWKDYFGGYEFLASESYQDHGWLLGKVVARYLAVESENITRCRQALLWSFPSFILLGGQVPPAERSELILPVQLPMCKATCCFLTDLHISTTDGEVEDSSSTGLETARSERVKKVLVSI